MNGFKFKNGYALGFEGQNKLFFDTIEKYIYARNAAAILYRDIWDGQIPKTYRVNRLIPKYRFISNKKLYQNIYKLKEYWENL